MSDKLDLRIQRTRDSIRSAFEDMICEMDYSKITVKELTVRARINRKTFYLHYNTLEDLLREVQDEMAESFIERTKTFDPVEDVEEITREFFLFLEEHGKFGERITCSGNYEFLSRKMMKTVMKRSWEVKKEMNTDLEHIIMAFISQSTLAIYRQWVKDGKKIPLETIIHLTSELINNGVRQLDF